MCKEKLGATHEIRVNCELEHVLMLGQGVLGVSLSSRLHVVCQTTVGHLNDEALWQLNMLGCSLGQRGELPRQNGKPAGSQCEKPASETSRNCQRGRKETRERWFSGTWMVQKLRKALEFC